MPRARTLVLRLLLAALSGGAAQKAARQKLQFGTATFGGLCPLKVPVSL